MPLGVNVQIGSLILGDATGSYSNGESNPETIDYSMDFNIITHDCVSKPKTQCTQPYGLWVLDLHFTTTKSAAKNKLVDMNAGPYWVITDLISIPMYVQRKKASQKVGSPNVYTWSLTLKECYDGATESSVAT